MWWTLHSPKYVGHKNWNIVIFELVVWRGMQHNAFMTHISIQLNCSHQNYFVFFSSLRYSPNWDAFSGNRLQWLGWFCVLKRDMVLWCAMLRPQLIMPCLKHEAIIWLYMSDGRKVGGRAAGGVGSQNLNKILMLLLRILIFHVFSMSFPTAYNNHTYMKNHLQKIPSKSRTAPNFIQTMHKRMDGMKPSDRFSGRKRCAKSKTKSKSISHSADAISVGIPIASTCTAGKENKQIHRKRRRKREGKQSSRKFVPINDECTCILSWITRKFVSIDTEYLGSVVVWVRIGMHYADCIDIAIA